MQQKALTLILCSESVNDGRSAGGGIVKGMKCYHFLTRGWSVLSLAVSPSHRQCTVSVLIVDELASSRNLEPNFCAGEFKLSAT